LAFGTASDRRARVFLTTKRTKPPLTTTTTFAGVTLRSAADALMQMRSDDELLPNRNSVRIFRHIWSVEAIDLQWWFFRASCGRTREGYSRDSEARKPSRQCTWTNQTRTNRRCCSCQLSGQVLASLSIPVIAKAHSRPACHGLNPRPLLGSISTCAF
jgi:hypothetical protein